MNQDESSWRFVVEIIFYRVSMLLCRGTVPIPGTAMLKLIYTATPSTKTKEKEKKEGTVITVCIEKTKNGKQKFCTIQ
jgi:hypothetical protein